ncbi:MAG TPA: methionine--tRNA ligase [Anaerolineales bacterium]|nr:methionine--tRNA ligase [Anaerolineales bacterium]HLB48788.1 methionine--tRNA ligase [Anaerolineales bacterium]
MTENILVSVAWPYANADIHVGNITGAYLPADVFARFHRLKGNRVLMVSGTDAHGTPITVRADAEGVSAEEVYKRYHHRFLDLFVKFGVTYDLFTTTHTENHFKVSQDIFLALKQNGYLYTQTEKQWYAPGTGRFLPDRYVEGECYICHYPNARGDQCDHCGSLLDSTQLINPRAKGGGELELRETEHFYLDLGKLAPDLERYLSAGKDHWRPNVINRSRQDVDELRGRPITRDLDWGIPVPVEGWDGKCLYVWFEAVIGYFSASIEWSRNNGRPEAWKDWWYDSNAKTYYFIGKDNIPFHAVIWPAQLIGTRRLYESDPGKTLNLPYDVPANEFLNLEGQKISGSRNWAVWGLDSVERYDPDALRYYLLANMPEARDADWSWSEFVARNNNELVATWGNLANRMLSFAYKNFDGAVPEPGDLRPEDNELLATVNAGFNSVGDLLSAVKLRAALGEALRVASEVNRYLDVRAPWSEIRTDRAAAAKTVYTSLRAIDSLKTLFAPFLPFTSEKLHGYLGYDGSLFGAQTIETYTESNSEHEALTYDPTGAVGKWQPSQLKGGQPLRQPAPLFKKLDEKVAEEEVARLHGK